MKISGVRSVVATLLLLVVVALPGSVRAQEEADSENAFPETTQSALRYYEESVPISEWAEGPVEYLMLDYERELWNALDVDVEKEAFQQWFWDRRDPDPRDDDHEPQEAFYERVARSNQRFHGFPRGWRSDRGRVWITLGPPSGGMRRTSLAGYGRCNAREGEWWTYYTNNMAFQASFGEFSVVFVETRIGQFEICDPTMLGVGAYPVDLRQAMQISREAMVLDSVTEFDVTLDMARRSAGVLPVRELEGGVEPLAVPAEWDLAGVAGAVVVPVEVPLRDLLFEPVGDSLRATLEVEAALIGLGGQEGQSGVHAWQVELDADAGGDIGSAALRTALVLPAEPGGYAARVRVSEPLSGRVLVWEDAVEVRPDGAAISPFLVGRTLVQLREAGEVAVIGADRPRLAAGEPFAAVAWVRGGAVDAADVALTLIDADNVETVLEAEQIAWGNQAAAGPLVIQAALPELATGRYVLRIATGGGREPSETVVEVR